MRVYQLAPLNADDIRLAAKANGKDPDTIIRQVEDAKALPLATIPITLEMLLQTGALTSNRLELYEKGTRRLCRQAEEHDVSEKRLSERVNTASSMAAVMLLGDRYCVDIESESIGESVLSVRDLLRDTNSENEEKRARETLKTGLFQGDRQRSWMHQSFAEYLAAVYLSAPEITVKEIVKLTTNGKGVFATQLYEVLRWLIEMRPDVLNEIVERQPELFLTTDLSHLNDNDFPHVYKAMLSLDDPYIYSSRAWDLKKFRATHSSAGRVLLPYLQDNESNVYRRRFVLDLLECHGYPEMEDTLVSLALNEYEDGVLRRLAARGLWKVGSVEAKLELKPYVFGRQDDSDDELKGYALQALWPDQLTAEELFRALVPPKRKSFYGSYKQFLFDDSIVNGIKAHQWSVALKWVSAQPSRHEMPLSLQDLPGKIMRKAWENRHIPGVLEVFSQTTVEMTLRFDGIFGGNSYDHHPSDGFEKAFVLASEARRELVLLSLSQLLAKCERASRLTYSRPPLVVPEDLDWLLTLLDSESDAARRGQLAELVACLTSYDIEKVYEASYRHPEVKERTKHYFEARLDDPNVISDREHFYQMKEIDEQIAQQRAEVRPFERLQEALDQFETGETLQWQNVIYSLAHHPDGRGESWNFNPDLTDFPLWEFCDQETQHRTVRAATTYVNEQEVVPSKGDDDDWFVSRSVPFVELHGYLAMFLLLKERPNALDTLLASRWERWAKIIVWQPYCNPVDISQTEHRNTVVRLQNELIARLYWNVPETFLQLVALHLKAEEKSLEGIYSKLDKVEAIWDVRIGRLLMTCLLDLTLSAQTHRQLLDRLLRHDSAEAVQFAEEYITRGDSDDVKREHLVELSVGLMQGQVAFDWSIIWNAITNNEDLGRAIIEKCAEEDGFDEKFGAQLRARELADLFLWIEERYPSDKDPQIDRVHAVSTREQVGRWRNNIIAELRKKNSQEALLEIRRILDRFPQLEWLNMTRIDLEKAVVESNWSPPSPREVLELVKTVDEQQIGKRQTARNFLKTHWKWLIVIFLTVLTIIVMILLPEIRQYLGLESVPTAKPAKYTGSAMSTVQPDETVDDISLATADTVLNGDNPAGPTSTELSITPESAHPTRE